MISTTTTKMSSKGQIVIPEGVRERLHLKAGDVFLVYDNKDTIVLKAAAEPSTDEFDTIVKQAQDYARKTGLKTTDVSKTIRKVRSRS